MTNGIIYKFAIISICVLLLSACNWNKRTEFIPVYVEVPIIHPPPYNDLRLNNPQIDALDKIMLSERASKMDDNEIIYVLDEYNMRLWLDDDVSKLEYLQYEKHRADYYKTYIDDFNKRIKEMNNK